MISRIGRLLIGHPASGRRGFSKRNIETAIIGNNPKVPELIAKYGISKYIKANYFKDEAEMMAPRNYEAALIVNSNPKQMEDFLKAQPTIKWIHSTMAGVDWVLNEKLKKSDILLTNAKGAFSYSLAEYVLFGILYFQKKTPYFNEQRKNHNWAPIDVEFASERKVGIIGYGDIGFNTADLLKRSLNATIYACCESRRSLPPEYYGPVDKLLNAASYDKVLQHSDFVVGILPKTPATTNYFCMDKFKMMKKSAVFINIGRGVTMVEKDLVKALKDGIIAGAVLDVFPEEPLPKTSELYEMKNVLMTYHCADRTPDYWERTMKVYKRELKAYVIGEKPINLIAKDKGY